MTHRNEVAAAEELLTVTEVSDRLRVSKRTIHRYAAMGRIPCVKLPGNGALRFTASDVNAFLQAHQLTSPVPA